MIRHVIVVTHTGSRYEVQFHEHNSTWYMRGDNVPNPDSVKLDGEWWAIDHPAPWPPIHGESLLMQAHRSLALNDPKRVSGGGKWTSPVVDIQILEADGLNAES